MAERIGLFGGSFNPIHFGHLIVARCILERLSLDQVLFLPSRQPPHKENKVLADAGHRENMVRLAIEGECEFEIDRFDLTRSGPCYSIDTIAHFRAQLPAAELFWFVGADSLAELPTWHRAKELVLSCNIVTALRSSHTVDWAQLERAFGNQIREQLRRNVVETPIIDISATEIRKRVASARSIRFLVPESVREYIKRHRLYSDLHV